MEFEPLLLPLLVFCLRALNNAMGTVRVIVMTYGRRRLSFVLAFFESIIFAFTAAQVLTDLNNLPNLFAYSLGFAVGGYLGMMIEDRFVVGFRTVNIITQQEGHAIADALRQREFGVTETIGEGGRGRVEMLRCVVTRQQVPEVYAIIDEINRDAFVTVEEARAVHRGWMRTARLKRPA